VRNYGNHGNCVFWSSAVIFFAKCRVFDDFTEVVSAQKLFVTNYLNSELHRLRKVHVFYLLSDMSHYSHWFTQLSANISWMKTNTSCSDAVYFYSVWPSVGHRAAKTFPLHHNTHEEQKRRHTVHEETRIDKCLWKVLVKSLTFAFYRFFLYRVFHDHLAMRFLVDAQSGLIFNSFLLFITLQKTRYARPTNSYIFANCGVTEAFIHLF